MKKPPKLNEKMRRKTRRTLINKKPTKLDKKIREKTDLIV